ncbi:hypothetical protein OH77DRAFT_1477311 [Trametes cingulata]|nr:hypothetical protein OH77DRAFT_1477311 [Trametes cingulata]
MSASLVDSERSKPSPIFNNWKAENVFKGPSADDMRRQICLLTMALARCPDGPPTSSALLSSDLGLKKKLNLLRHVATLLTIGTDSDRTAATVNAAVTGSLEPDRVVCLIATESGPAALDNNSTSDAEVVKLEVGENRDEIASDLLENRFERSGKCKFDQHLREITAILSYILGRPAADRPPLLPKLTFWVTRRAFMKLSARLHNANAIWGKDLAQLLRLWSEQDHPDEPIIVSMRLPSPIFSSVLADSGIQPAKPEDSTHNSKSNHSEFSGTRKAWLSVMSSLLSVLQEILLPGGRMRGAELDKVESITTSVAIRSLDQILTSNLATKLDGDRFNHKLQGYYNDRQKAKHRKWLREIHQAGHIMEQAQQQHGDLEPELDEADALDDSDSDSSNKEPAEDAVGHLWRYLQTLTAWDSAAKAFCHSRFPPRPLVVYQLRSSPTLTIDKDHVEEFVNSYLAAVKEHCGGSEGAAYGNADAFLKKAFYEKDRRQVKTPVRPTLHAEAALMALARSRYHPSEAQHVQGLESVDSIFTSDQVVIGVSKKCCRCCSLFAEHMSSSSEEDQKLEFVLPGTHSIIYPWLPPTFGVPDNVLASMRGALFATFHRVALEHDAGLASTQSSPTSDDEHSTEEWHTEYLAEEAERARVLEKLKGGKRVGKAE